MPRQPRTFLMVSSNVITPSDTLEQNSRDGVLDVQSGPSAPPNTMWTETSSGYVHRFVGTDNEEVAKMQVTTLYQKPTQKSYGRNKFDIDTSGFLAGESSKALNSLVKTLVHHYLRDMHIKGNIL